MTERLTTEAFDIDVKYNENGETVMNGFTFGMIFVSMRKPNIFDLIKNKSYIKLYDEMNKHWNNAYHLDKK